MDRTEQKDRLSDILVSISDLKIELKDKVEVVELALSKIDDLDDVLSDVGEVDSWDADELRSKVMSASMDEFLQVVYYELYDFKNDLDSYMDELSESRREKLEDRYADLGEVLEKFSYSNQEYEDIENALEHIEEAEQMIKDMKK